MRLEGQKALARKAIRCNAIPPGWIDTDLNEEYSEGMDEPVAFLGSNDAAFITRDGYKIDGGHMTTLSLP